MGAGGKVAQASHGNCGLRRPSPTYIISPKLISLDVAYVMLNRYRPLHPSSYSALRNDVRPPLGQGKKRLYFPKRREGGREKEEHACNANEHR